MTCQFGTCSFSMVWWHFIHLGLIGPISPRKGLDPFRLRHAGGGIKLASWITPCSVCTVAPEPELLCGGGPLGFCIALLHLCLDSYLHLTAFDLTIPTCLSATRWTSKQLLVWCFGGCLVLLARSYNLRFVELVWLEAAVVFT